MENSTSLANEFDLRLPINFSQDDNENNTSPIPHISLIILGISLLTAWLGNLLFYDQSVGINISLYVISLVGGGVVMLLRYQRHIEPKHAIFGLPAIVFSVCLAWTANEGLQFLNLLFTWATLFVFFRFVSHKSFLGGHWLIPVISGLNIVLLGWLEAPMVVINASRQRVKHVELQETQVHSLLSVIRGCFLAVPVVAVFGLLLASADVVLRAELDSVFSTVVPDSIDEIIGQSILIFMLAWGALVAYKTMLFTNKSNNLDVWEPTIPEKNPWKWINMIEAGVVLVSVILLFVVAVFIQARYLFGGGANISDYGYTYSEYARRGFFEIVAVSFMTMSLVVGLKIITKRDSLQQENYFRGLNASIIGLTLILLVGAFERLSIYVDAYGFTRLRLETRVFIVWLSLLFLVLIYDLFQPKLKWFWVGAIVVTLGYVMTLNVMNEDRFIANYNIDRFERTGKIDIYYLTALSDDAIPVIVPLLENEDLAEDDLTSLKIGLGHRLYELDQYEAEASWVAYHYSKKQAWKALDEYRPELDTYIEPRVDFYDEGFDTRDETTPFAP